MVTEQVVYAFGWAPWSCIVAGGITALALSVVLAVLGVALGFTVIEPKSDHPASGLGVAFGVWGVVSVIISVAGGGFMAGYLSGQRGLEIGFLVWAVTTLGGMCFGGLAIGAAVRLVGAAVVNVGSGAASAAATVGRGVADAASGIAAELKDSIRFDFDAERVNENVMGVLRDTGIETLQPEYLRDQLRETKNGLLAMVRQLALDPSSPEKAVNDFVDQAKSRLASLTRGIDREAAVTALMKTRDIPRNEAEKLVENAVNAYNKVLEKGGETLDEVKAQVAQGKEQLKTLAAKTREKADEVASAAAKAALGAAAALIIAAVVSMGAAHCGAKIAPTWAVAGQVQNTGFVR